MIHCTVNKTQRFTEQEGAMRYNIRKMTYEDRFDRNFRCNAHRFLPDMKRSNRREFRRKIKNDLRKQIRGEEDRAESKGDE